MKQEDNTERIHVQLISSTRGTMYIMDDLEEWLNTNTDKKVLFIIPLANLPMEDSVDVVWRNK